MVFLASCLWLLCHKILPHFLPLENLKLCWEKTNATYKEKKVTDRYRGVTELSLFKGKEVGLSSKGEHLKWPAWRSLFWSYGNSMWTQKFWHTGKSKLG